jgi:hypothetical protein
MPEKISVGIGGGREKRDKWKRREEEEMRRRRGGAGRVEKAERRRYLFGKITKRL